ncbi:MAG: pseudouridine synthase [Lachnospiraceae bacterium]|nr:pseudouridine synthase [Lachnospiraceae bacterium]
MEQEIRINKYIADAGICSRRAADKLIEDGKVIVNGKVAESGQKVSRNDTVIVDGKEIKSADSKVYLLFNKPVGVVCTADKKEKNNIIDYINYKTRIMYAGRLDKDSEGLMLMTNDGDLIDSLMRAKNAHEKEYVVEVKTPIDKNFIYSIRNGVYLEELDVTTRKCKATLINSKSFRITLTEGHNRQIRRMCEALGNEVTALKRVRIVNLLLGDLAVGKYRNLTREEAKTLFTAINYKKGKNHG